MSHDLHRLLRTLKPEKRSSLPPARAPDQLRAASAGLMKRPILLDTTAYINAGQGNLPSHISQIITEWPNHHCSIALGEIAHGLGRLDAAHPDTARHSKYLEAILEQVPRHRVLNPTGEMHIAGGIITGMIARLQNLSKGAHRSRINDVLIYLTARAAGAAVVTANIGDFDLIQQLVPDGQVIFY